LRNPSFIALVKEKELEGIIAERKTSTYRPGKRSPDWLKIKAWPEQEIQRMRGFLKRHAPDTLSARVSMMSDPEFPCRDISPKLVPKLLNRRAKPVCV
jgi:hypothetical protein